MATRIYYSLADMNALVADLKQFVLSSGVCNSYQLQLFDPKPSIKNGSYTRFTLNIEQAAGAGWFTNIFIASEMQRTFGKSIASYGRVTVYSASNPNNYPEDSYLKVKNYIERLKKVISDYMENQKIEFFQNCVSGILSDNIISIYKTLIANGFGSDEILEHFVITNNRTVFVDSNFFFTVNYSGDMHLLGLDTQKTTAEYIRSLMSGEWKLPATLITTPVLEDKYVEPIKKYQRIRLSNTILEHCSSNYNNDLYKNIIAYANKNYYIVQSSEGVLSVKPGCGAYSAQQYKVSYTSNSKSYIEQFKQHIVPFVASALSLI